MRVVQDFRHDRLSRTRLIYVEVVLTQCLSSCGRLNWRQQDVKVLERKKLPVTVPKVHVRRYHL
eukprot:13404-Eustigmatos_ZCMA.PRE.1